MKLLEFSNFSLTRSEMKSIKGGGTIYCTCMYETGPETGVCGGPHAGWCLAYGCQNGGTMKECWEE
ncbi:MAG: TIGR04149 family rSAM-modified RiPP [Bacteroidetes bacterium]|nr:TIGR04149 family rSAM-modified RiPP [Bacteroidota bacterium]